MALQINKLSRALGGEIRGLDLSQPLDDVTIAAVRRAWVDHLVLCVPGQRLSPPQQIAFCARFGPLDDHCNRPLWNPLDHPEVKIVSNKPQTIGGKNLMTLVADKWHTDMSFSNRSAAASWLHALQLPEIWKTRDVLMWDNRCAMHFAVQDYDPDQLCVLQRCTLFAPVDGQYYDPDEPDGIRKAVWSRKTTEIPVADVPATDAPAPTAAAAMQLPRTALTLGTP